MILVSISVVRDHCNNLKCLTSVAITNLTMNAQIRTKYGAHYSNDALADESAPTSHDSLSSGLSGGNSSTSVSAVAMLSTHFALRPATRVTSIYHELNHRRCNDARSK